MDPTDPTIVFIHRADGGFKLWKALGLVSNGHSINTVRRGSDLNNSEGVRVALSEREGKASGARAVGCLGHGEGWSCLQRPGMSRKN